jgi:hypothetical protein
MEQSEAGSLEPPEIRLVDHAVSGLRDAAMILTCGTGGTLFDVLISRNRPVALGTLAASQSHYLA